MKVGPHGSGLGNLRMDKQYARFEIGISVGGERRRLEGLVSEHGVRRVFEVGTLPNFWESLTGQSVDVEIHSLVIPGVFTRELLPDSSYYNIRFRSSDAGLKEKLKRKIDESGFPPPWKRTYPRIPAEIEIAGVGLPTIALVENSSGVQFYKIVNFTLGGVLMESEPDAEQPMSLGHKFYFQMMISNGASISGVWGRVVRIDEESTGGRRFLRYGVQLVSMSSAANKKYRTLILDYCETVKKMYRA